MKIWVYRVIWNKRNKQVPDGHIFRNLAEAETYAGIELTQMELNGWHYHIETLELL